MRRAQILVLTLVGFLAFASPAAADHDTSAPIVSYTLSGTAGTNGWYRSNVTINWSVTEPEGLTSAPCQIAQLVTSEGPSTHTCTAMSHGGTASSTVNLKIDKTAPTGVTGALARGSDANGWYNRAVGAAFAGTDAVSGIASCSSPTYSGPDTASTSVAGTCTDVAGNTSAPAAVTLKYDATAPSATVALARGPDSNGWFNHPVSVTASGADSVSGLASCTAPSYGGPDSASAAVGATCTDNAGNTSAPAIASLKYDATAPTVTPAADRPPDGKGWYRRALTVSFRGTDSTSGIASCTVPTRYKGPDRASASVAGSCRDAAGNAAEAMHAFRYDATAPKLAKAQVKLDRGVARLDWQRSTDAVSVELVRRPGVNGARSTVVYRGKGVSFADKTVRNGIRYRYVIRAADAAGNVAQKVVTTVARRPLYRPEAGAVVRAPVVLAWDGIAGAKFYNLQLLRQGVKVLSTWPRKTTFRLRPSWRYAGRSYRLEPGRYTWYVWPATGTLERPRYGRPLGTSTFVVKRT